MILHYISGEAYVFQTFPSQDFGMVTFSTRSTYLNFKVQACSSANVGLFTATYSYEVQIGHNENTMLSIFDKRQTRPVAYITIGSLLSCDEMRYFYVSFDNGNIEVGKGSFPGIKLLEYEDSNAERVTAVSMKTATTGDSSLGEWEFRRKLGKSISIPGYTVYML